MAELRKFTHSVLAGTWRPVLLIMVLALVALACNAPFGGSDDDGPLSVAQSATIRPELTLPDGWSMEEATDGLVVAAADPADLDEQRQPGGPRLIVRLGEDSTANPDTLVNEALTDGEAVESTQVIEEAAVIDVGKGDGVAITLAQGSIIRRIVLVNLGQGRAYQIVAEAPSEKWPIYAAQLESIIASARFLNQ